MCQIPVVREEAQTRTPWQNQPSQMTTGNLTKGTNKRPSLWVSARDRSIQTGPLTPITSPRSPPSRRLQPGTEWRPAANTRVEPLRTPAGARRARGRKAQAVSAPCGAQRPRAHAAPWQRDVGSRRRPPRWPRLTLRSGTHSEINAGAPGATKTKRQPARAWARRPPASPHTRAGASGLAASDWNAAEEPRRHGAGPLCYPHRARSLPAEGPASRTEHGQGKGPVSFSPPPRRVPFLWSLPPRETSEPQLPPSPQTRSLTVASHFPAGVRGGAPIHPPLEDP